MDTIIDLLLTNRNDKSPNIVETGGWRFIIGKGKINNYQPSTINKRLLKSKFW